MNISKIPYCPIVVGLNFLDQAKIMEELNEIDIENIAYPILIIPFLSRASEVIGKKIMLNIDNLEFLLNYNQSIFCNNSITEILKNSKKINIKFIENKDSFSENDWQELYKLSEETFVEETERLKQTSAGAGLTDND